MPLAAQASTGQGVISCFIVSQCGECSYNALVPRYVAQTCYRVTSGGQHPLTEAVITSSLFSGPPLICLKVCPDFCAGFAVPGGLLRYPHGKRASFGEGTLCTLLKGSGSHDYALSDVREVSFLLGLLAYDISMSPSAGRSGVSVGPERGDGEDRIQLSQYFC